jgi:hypothetical protein
LATIVNGVADREDYSSRRHNTKQGKSADDDRWVSSGWIRYLNKAKDFSNPMLSEVPGPKHHLTGGANAPSKK